MSPCAGSSQCACRSSTLWPCSVFGAGPVGCIPSLPRCFLLESQRKPLEKKECGHLHCSPLFWNLVSGSNCTLSQPRSPSLCLSSSWVLETPFLPCVSAAQSWSCCWVPHTHPLLALCQHLCKCLLIRTIWGEFCLLLGPQRYTLKEYILILMRITTTTTATVIILLHIYYVSGMVIRSFIYMY